MRLLGKGFLYTSNTKGFLSLNSTRSNPIFKTITNIKYLSSKIVRT